MKIVNFLYKSSFDINSLILIDIINILTVTSGQHVGMIYDSRSILSVPFFRRLIKYFIILDT
jgi:hypothetical protein